MNVSQAPIKANWATIQRRVPFLPHKWNEEPHLSLWLSTGESRECLAAIHSSADLLLTLPALEALRSSGSSEVAPGKCFHMDEQNTEDLSC